VSVILAQMLELTDEDIVVVIGAVSDGSWSQVVDNDLGASASYLFSAGIDTTTALGVNIPNEARIELQYYMFNSETQLSVGNVAFNALPSFAKFTIRIFDWPWRSSPENHRIEFHMKIDPPFTSFVEQTNTPNVTTYVLAGQYPAVAGQPNTTSALRLLNTVEIDGEQVESGVSFLMNTDSSELMLYFNYFESTLVYDPGKHSQSRLHSWWHTTRSLTHVCSLADVGVQVPSTGRRGGEDIVLIVCLTVILPIFALFAFISLLLVGVALVKQRGREKATRKATLPMHDL
jgi:hypothetical protein